MSVFKNVVLKHVLNISYLSIAKPFFYTTVLSSKLKSKKKLNIWKLYIRTFLFFFFKKIEYSLNNYTRSLYLFLPTIYNRFKPFIKSAKIVCEVIVLGIESGKSIKQVFSMVKT